MSDPTTALAVFAWTEESEPRWEEVGGEEGAGWWALVLAALVLLLLLLPTLTLRAIRVV